MKSILTICSQTLFDNLANFQILNFIKSDYNQVFDIKIAFYH